MNILFKKRFLLGFFLFSSFGLLGASCSPMTTGPTKNLKLNEEASGIFGGEPLNRATPEYIYLMVTDRGSFCHAIRITNSHLLTAAHCFDTSQNYSQFNLVQLDANSNPIEYRGAIRDVVIHPEYKTRRQQLKDQLNDPTIDRLHIRTRFNHFDLAVIRLNSQVLPEILNNPVRILNQQNQNVIDLAKSNQVTNFVFYSLLQHTSITSNSRTHVRFLSQRLVLTINKNIFGAENQLWARDRSLTTAICAGDSGGGLFAEFPSLPGRKFLVGIAYAGFSVQVNSYCRDSLMFANPSVSFKWITEVVRASR